MRVPGARGPGIFRSIATVLGRARRAPRSGNLNVYLAIVAPLLIVILALVLV
jgi:hypothetical protein